MKNKFLEFFKALGAFIVIFLVIAVGIIGIIGELFPAAIPDWVRIAALIVCLPLWIAAIRYLIKEERRKPKDKKAQKEKIKKK